MVAKQGPKVSDQKVWLTSLCSKATDYIPALTSSFLPGQLVRKGLGLSAAAPNHHHSQDHSSELTETGSVLTENISLLMRVPYIFYKESCSFAIPIPFGLLRNPKWPVPGERHETGLKRGQFPSQCSQQTLMGSAATSP